MAKRETETPEVIYHALSELRRGQSFESVTAWMSRRHVRQLTKLLQTENRTV